MKKGIIMIMSISLLAACMPGQGVSAKSPGLSMKQKKLILTVGDKKKLSLSAASKKQVRKVISWKSSDRKVVSVSDSGNVKALSSGTVVVTASVKLKEGKAVRKINCRISVVKKEDPSSTPTSVSAPTDAPAQSSMPAIPVPTASPEETKTMADASVAPGTEKPVEAITPTPKPTLAVPLYDNEVPIQESVAYNGDNEICGIAEQDSPAYLENGVSSKGMRIDSIEEMKDFINTVEEETGNESADIEYGKSQCKSFVDLLQGYDAAFFEDKSLLVGSFMYSRGYEISLKQITREEACLACEVSVEKVLTEGMAVTDDAVTYVSVAAVDKKAIEGAQSCQFYFVLPDTEKQDGVIVVED